VRNSERRFHYYYTIAKMLGANGQRRRAKLPSCVTQRIAKTFPDAEGAPTKVGYRQD
jgi:hypothetical protein